MKTRYYMLISKESNYPFESRYGLYDKFYYERIFWTRQDARNYIKNRGISKDVYVAKFDVE